MTEMKANFDFKGRIERAKQKMEKANLDALYITAGPNQNYFLGWSAYEGGWPIWLSAFILPRDGSPTFLLTKMHADIFAETGSWFKDGDIRTYYDGEDPTDLLRTALQEKHLMGKRMGVEDKMWYGDYALIKSVAPDIKVEDAGDLILQLRMVKDEGEIESIKKANKASEAGFRRAMEVIGTGKSEEEAALEISKAMLKAGSERMGAGGTFRQIWHRNFEKGDIIDVDIGAKVNGYGSDTARNAFVGRPDKENTQIYELTLQCFNDILDRLHVGIQAGELDEFTADFMTKHRLIQPWKLGHGIGLGMHEYPFLQRGQKIHLEPNMTFVIDPGVFIKGQIRDMPIHIEDGVLLKNNGYELLHDFPRELDALVCN